MESAISLSALQTLLGNTIRMNRAVQNVWVQAEISDLRIAGGHCYMELVEKDDNGVLRAKLRAMIWSSTLMPLRSKFYESTGRDLMNGLKVLVKGSATHHNLYGLAFTISDIDPSFTLGDMERLRREILLKLTAEGIINRNKSLSLPATLQKIAVISAEGAAGYGDFMNQIVNNQDGFAIYTCLFPAVMQGERTVPTVLEALNMVSATCDLWDAVVIIRGGGATTDLNSFDNYELAREVATFPLPVIVGIGHERDRTVLDEIACVRCKTPTAVAEFIIGNLREAYGRIGNIMRLITKYAEEALKGENLRIATLTQSVPAFAQNSVLKQRLRLTEYTGKLKDATGSEVAAANRRLSTLALRLSNDASLIAQKESLKLERFGDMVRLLSPENTLKRGYSISRINGRAISETSEVKPGDLLETTLFGGKIESIVK